MTYIKKYKSPLGNITIASDGEAITGLWFAGQKYFESTIKGPVEETEFPVFEDTVRWLDCYFEGNIPGFTPPLAPYGSPFSKAVWDILLAIPYGKTTTYGQIASQIANARGNESMSAQAVGGAVARNPISLIIPCHRVVGTNGSLTGYAGGIDKKIALLKIEKVDMSHLFIPKKGTAL